MHRCFCTRAILVVESPDPATTLNCVCKQRFCNLATAVLAVPSMLQCAPMQSQVHKQACSRSAAMR